MANIRIRTRPSAGSNFIRPRPQGNGQFGLWISDKDKFSAYIHADVLDLIRKKGELAAPDETIGLLAGRVCHDPVIGPYTLVMAAENALPEEYESNPGRVKLKAVGQTQVRRRLEEAHPDREIIGWYHSHPNHSPFFSPVDAYEQKTWSDPNYIGIVYSTDDGGQFGVYRGPESIRLRAFSDPIPIPKPVPMREDLDLPQPPVADGIVRPEPSVIKENIVLTPAPMTLSTKIQLVILGVFAVISVIQALGLYLLDRRVAFMEGQLYQLAVTPPAPERLKETATRVPLSSPRATASQSPADQADGPEVQVPSKPVTKAPIANHQLTSGRRRADNQKQARGTKNANRHNNSGKAADRKDTDKANVKKQTPATPAATESKPTNGPKPQATPNDQP